VKKILFLLSLILFIPVICMDEKMDVEEPAERLISLPVSEGEEPRNVDLNQEDPIAYETFATMISAINLAIEKKEEQIPHLRLAEVVTTIDEKPFYHHFLSDSIDDYIKDQVLNKHQANPENPLNRQPITRIYFYTYHPEERNFTRDELILEPPFAIQEDAIVHQDAPDLEALENLLQELSPRAHAHRYNQERQRLDLSNLDLYSENIPADFFTRLAHILPNLKTLDVSNNDLERLPDTIGNLANLKRLNVYNNQLRSLPESIGTLANLQELDVSHNHLGSLPETIGTLANLQELYVSHNHLGSLPETIGTLANLQWLNVNYNQLRSLPETIGNLANLQELYVSVNYLESLPDTIGNLAHLQRLNVSHNPHLALSPALRHELENRGTRIIR